MKKILTTVAILSVLMVGCGSDPSDFTTINSAKYLGSQEMVINETTATVNSFESEDGKVHLLYTREPENWVLKKGEEYNVKFLNKNTFTCNCENMIQTIEYVK